MRGRFFDEQRTPEDFTKAFGFFEQATTQDPQYAQAWAAFASSKVLDDAIFLGGSEQQAAVADARRLVDRALSLAPDSSYVNAVNSRVMSSGELRFADAERARAPGRRAAPTTDALGELARTLAWLGDASGAEALQRQGLQTDPRDGNTWFWLSVNLAGQGRLDEAEQAIDRAIETSPASAIGVAQRTIVEVLQGNYGQALASARAVPPGPWHLIAVAFATQRAGDAEAADRAPTDLIEQSSTGRHIRLPRSTRSG
jgi:tetratricopeptide (TPR) repeat protein